MSYQAVVIGVSSGGINALPILLSCLPADYPIPVMIVQHMQEGNKSLLAELLDSRLPITVSDVTDKMPISGSTVYIAPSGYHLLVEPNGILALSIDPRVNYARPSVDVLFESAADEYLDKLIGVILTGRNSDGSAGLKKIKLMGGLTIVQDPDEAEAFDMPEAAIRVVEVDHILPLKQIGQLLADIVHS